VTTSVAMQNTAFVPPAIQVSPGAVVTFTNGDNTAHNVTFNSGGATNIGDFTTGSRTTTMTTAPGTYSYRCTIHAGMNGTITVQ
jgi:plastocyanin